MLPKFSVRRPMTVLVAVLLVVVLGVISFTSMKTDLLPGFDLPYVAVITQYPGASPEKVETEVTKIIESTLATTGGVENVQSVSSENVSMVVLEFSYGTSMDSAIIDMSSKLDTAKSMLADGVGTPTMMQISMDSVPVLIGTADIDGKDIFETSSFVTDTLIPSLEKVEGVASVTAMGTVEKSVKITLDQAKIDSLNSKILASIDSTLAEKEKDLASAKAALEAARKSFEEQSAQSTEQLLGKQTELQNKLSEAENGKKTLSDLIVKAQQTLADLAAQPQTPETAAAAAKVQAAIDEYQSQAAAIEAGIPAIKDGLSQIEIAKLELTKKLSVAEVELSDKEAQYEEGKKAFDEARDEAYKNANLGSVITADTVSGILSASNFEMPAGYLTENGVQYAVKVGDRFGSIEEVSAIEMFNISAGSIGAVRLTDIATVGQTDNSDEMYAKINGNDGIIFMVQKQSTASTAEVSSAIHAAMDKVIAQNDGLHITYLNDQGVYIDVVIGTVLQNLGLGAILAILILLLFLRNIRPTFIVAVSIPVSVLLAIVLMYFSGVNLNIISLGGLALGIGMLVDNSIVVIENIYRLRASGVSAAKAAVQGAVQVSGAILASTLTTICVFLPILFINGMSRELFSDMGLTIAYSLLASLAIALTVVPAASANMIKKQPKAEPKLAEKFSNGYKKLLSGALKHKFIPLSLALLLLGTSIFGAFNMGLSFIPTTNSDKITVSVTPEKGTSTDDARALSDEITARINTIDGIETVGAMQGGSMLGMSMSGGGSNNISMYVVLESGHKLTSTQVSTLIKEKTEDLPCDVTAEGSSFNMSALSGSGLEVVIKGDDLDTLQKTASEVAALVKQTNGTEKVSDGNEETDEQTHITVDKNKALSYGLTVAQVYQKVAAAIKNETTSTTLTLGGKTEDLIVAKGSQALTRETLGSFVLSGTKDGENVDVLLSDIAQITQSTAPKAINHENAARYMTVTAAIKEGSNIALVSRELEAKLKDYNAPDGYTVEITGENETITSSVSDLIKMVLLAVVLIYLIMVAIFQSLSSPFIVMFTIPLAFTGGILALWAFGFEISVIAMLGLLVLSGVVVNNGIVFVDCINQLRLEGMERRKAIITAGEMRIRPILMTALTTILGLLTLSFGLGSGADMLQPMAIVIVFGLLYATLLTLFVVPCLYDILKKKDLKKIDID